MEPFYRLNDYDQVAELTWENGRVGFQVPLPGTSTQFTWETANETLESIVQQGSTVFHNQPEMSDINLIQNSAANINSSSSFAASSNDNNHPLTWLETSPCNNGDRNVRACATDLRESETFTVAGTAEEDFTYNYGSDDKKDYQESKGVKGHSSSSRRSRTAEVHNQSERKRRDRINQKMKILQRLVPNASKTDKASMLDEVIKYLKNLQAQIQMMNYIRNMPQMMVPLGLQQQQMQLHNQISLLARAGMSMNIGMLGTGGMLNMMHTPRSLAPQSVPQQFLPSTSTSTDPIFPPFLMMPPMMTTATTPHISQSMNMDLYNKMAAFCSQQASKTTATQEKSSPTPTFQ